MSAVGTVYGVGVGPGDPELLTLKALRIIQATPVLAYAAAEGVPSFARSIAEPHLKDLPAKTEVLIASAPLDSKKVWWCYD